MSYKDLQVHVDNTTHCGQRIDVAAKLAASSDAHLTGIFVRQPLYLPSYIGPVGTDFLNTIETNYAQEVNKLETAAKQNFETITSQYEVQTAWHSVTGDVYAELTKEAAYADVLVLGQVDPDDTNGKIRDIADNLVLTAGRPCLVVPYIGAGKTVAKHPLIAWNGSRESNRALHDALPLLEQSDTVTIMVSDTSGKRASAELPNTRIAQHLARHNVKVMTKTMTSKKRQTSNDFLSYITDNGHDLLVMGAYGHSRFSEVVLGGMTREIMQSMTVPVLMSH